MLTRQNAEDILDIAVNALSSGEDANAILDELPVPIYTADAAGAVTYWNRACVDLAGRQPELGEDRWCVTWKLFTTAGTPLAHAECPMAQAIKQGRPVREAIAIAERPDGSRVAFRAYPTPLFDTDGTLVGAVNMLIDVSHEKSAELLKQADHCRRLAQSMYDRQTSQMLVSMAEGLDQTASELDRKLG